MEQIERAAHDRCVVASGHAPALRECVRARIEIVGQCQSALAFLQRKRRRQRVARTRSRAVFARLADRIVGNQYAIAAKMRASQLSGKTLTIKALTAEEGKLYGSIGVSDVVRAAADAGFELKRSEVDMPTGPIRQIGSHPVTIRLHTEVEASITVAVEEEKAA